MNKKPYPNLSVLVVEDEISIREEFQDFLDFYFGFVHVAVDGCNGLELIDKYHPDIIITDINMPCMNGLEMMEEAKKISANSIFIFTSAFSDTKYLLKAIDIKADSYIIKPIRLNTLLEKIKELLKNRVIADEENTHSTDTISQNKLLHKSLSSREYEVFIDIAKGIKPNNIAQKYGVKSKTISTYRKRILEKMCFNSNAEIIRYAIENRLI